MSRWFSWPRLIVTAQLPFGPVCRRRSTWLFPETPAHHTTRPASTLWVVRSTSLPESLDGCPAVTGLRLAPAVILVRCTFTAPRVCAARSAAIWFTSIEPQPDAMSYRAAAWYFVSVADVMLLPLVTSWNMVGSTFASWYRNGFAKPI